MEGSRKEEKPGRYGEEDDAVSSRQPPRATTRPEDENEMTPGGENEDGEDVERQVDVGSSEPTTTPLVEDEASIGLQVNAYVVGEPQGRKPTTAATTPIEATVIQNETQVEARTWWCLFWLIVVLLVVALALGIAMPLTVNDDNGDALETVAPTPTPELKDPWLILEPIIGKGGFKDGSVAQKAYRWLTKEDESGILDDPYTPEWRIVQRYVLANLYFATYGPVWWYQLRFLSKEHECTWKQTIPYFEGEGAVWLDGLDVTSLPAGVITCDTEGRVDSLRIAQNGLRNTIPSVLRYLSNLQELVLESNSFAGLPIPSWLADLTGLKLLVLAACSLTGSIPTELELLTNLQQLWLSGNLLTGTMPVSLFRALSDLRVLSFERNF